MPPLPTITNVLRCSYTFSAGVGGASSTNVFHVRTTRTDFDVIASDIRAANASNQWHWLQNTMVTTAITITPLDGVTAALVFPVTSFGGDSSGDLIPAVAGLVSFRTGVRGALGRGRVYIGPVAESVHSNGFLDSVSNVTTGWITWANTLATDSLELVVASYVHAVAHPVVTIAAEGRAATQRRRQDRIRRV